MVLEMGRGRLTSVLYESVRNIWEKIYNHPFVVELYRGTLPLELFKFYVIQDYNFLIGMVKAFSAIAVKTDDYVLIRKALEIAYNGISIELDNYVKLLDKLGLKLEDVIKAEVSPTNYAYVNHILITCINGSTIDCLVSILPCYWSYMEIARVNDKLVETNRNELYLNWINVYRSKEYISVVEDLKNTIDSLWSGGNVDRYVKIFRISSIYEYMFWDMSYRRERWSI